VTSDDPLRDAAKEISRAVEEVAESVAKTGKGGLDLALNPTRLTLFSHRGRGGKSGLKT
jgi:hypothetical protein